MARESWYTSVLALVVLCGACSSSVVAPVSPAAVMLGEWTYAVPHQTPAPTLNAGFRVEIAIDSLEGMRFWGRVTLWFAGDVGIAPSTFGRISGRIDEANAVRLVIPRAPAEDHPLTVWGELAADVLTIVGCQVGTAPGPFVANSAFVRLQSGE